MQRDAILLDMDLACIVGILPRERIEPQPLQLHLQLGIDLDPAGTTGDLQASVDYGAMDTQVRFLCVEGRFRLIEVLAVAIGRLLLAPPGPGEARAPLAWASITIRKPSVLRSAVAGVTLTRTAAWAAGADGVLAEVPEVFARRVILPAGASLAGSGEALLLHADPQVVGLPYTSAAPCTLLHVVSREVS